MKEYVDAIEELISNPDVARIDKSSEINYLIARQLFDQGLIDADEDKSYGGPALDNPKVNLAGLEWLESKRGTSSATPTEEDIVDVKPNFMGIGLNLNAAWKKWFKKT
jgi:hypothetical protein